MDSLGKEGIKLNRYRVKLVLTFTKLIMFTKLFFVVGIIVVSMSIDTVMFSKEGFILFYKNLQKVS